MRCLQCHGRTDVYDSRLLEDSGYRRKRKCTVCGFRFATIEVVDVERELRPRTPRAPKPKPTKPKIQKVRLPKAVKVKSVKPRRPEEEFMDFDETGLDSEIRDVAPELGIEGFR